MHINRNEFSRYIKNLQFRKLFIELGWDDANLDLPIAVDDQIFNLSAVAEKRGFTLFTCSPAANGKIPDSNSRKKIDRQITKRFFEHIIIFTNADKSHQIWQSSIREPNKPIIVRETHYYSHQSPEILFQKLSGLFFSLEEEDKIGLVDVRHRVAENFNKNTERVTKQFYDRFKKNHAAFLDFIQGISETVEREWYASLMLNRLMFIYFIQKKGFLDNDPDYLRTRLRKTQEKKGRDKFYSFYRDFLLVLFHRGLGSPERSAELEQEIGQVPYLNGGLFDEHRLEKDNPDLNIRDEAFERIFDFFDEYQWHLDTRVASSGKDINPDVIGYIFEKYINDRASMGAYYTKEDITDYISKNTIIPRLFDMVKKECSVAFEGESSLWNMLRENPDRYIYAAMRHGARVGLPQQGENLPRDERIAAGLPQEIAVGLDTSTPNLLERRKYWNKKAPQEIALPTEIYREVIERRTRYWEIYDKLSSGKICDINDLITYNLDMRQFAQDAVEYYEGSDFINAMHKALSRITILDPTCGSGAFLFAALNILEPLYETCLARMEEFVAADDLANGRRFPQFREVLKEMQNHPNAKYYIYKKIILQNLHGVDIMNEAVEIAKLRLFLKLVAELDDSGQVEPLPDIDFNIRAGNTLVGFATQKELHDAMSTTFDFDDMESIVHEKMGLAAMAFKRYKEVQLSGEEADDPAGYKTAKDELNQRLAELNEDLNHYLARQYGIEPTDKKKYTEWKASHKPFHWLAEFYEIIHANDGFDVIIGNPPYVNQNKIAYKFIDYGISVADIYGNVIVRSLKILIKEGNHGFIVMHNLAFSRGFSALRKYLQNERANIWFSFYARIPSGLFSGDVRVRNCIFIINRSKKLKKANTYTTRIHRWFSASRGHLFHKIRYVQFSFFKTIPMFDNEIESRLFQELPGEPLAILFTKQSTKKLYFKQTAYNWISVTPNPAACYNSKGNPIPQSQVKELNILNEHIQNLLILLLNGKLFFSYWLSFGDEFHVTKEIFDSFRIPLSKFDPNDIKILEKLSSDFTNRLDEVVQYKLNANKRVGTYNTSSLWDITDKSDPIFLKNITSEYELILDSLNNHVYKTVITGNDEYN